MRGSTGPVAGKKKCTVNAADTSGIFFAAASLRQP
jgi:hypothetical protein